MNERKSIFGAKLIANNQEDRLYKWKKHFQNIHRKAFVITMKNIKIINGQLDVKLDQFTTEGLGKLSNKKQKRSNSWRNTFKKLENKKRSNSWRNTLWKLENKKKFNSLPNTFWKLENKKKSNSWRNTFWKLENKKKIQFLTKYFLKVGK